MVENEKKVPFTMLNINNDNILYTNKNLYSITKATISYYKVYFIEYAYEQSRNSL